MSNSETIYLHSINELPFDAAADIFRRYPGFKLGVTQCVRYYAELMLPLVKELIANDDAHNDWVFTAPAITSQTPAGANLLCRDLFDFYLQERGASGLDECVKVGQ